MLRRMPKTLFESSNNNCVAQSTENTKARKGNLKLGTYSRDMSHVHAVDAYKDILNLHTRDASSMRLRKKYMYESNDFKKACESNSSVVATVNTLLQN